MEKKTIGSFIAALRRANGLTQRQLADKLCVSDKAVSRWERDEALPDLSLIPELADIFGVSADEILRGERQNPESRNSPASSDKGEKLRKRLLAKKKRSFSILSTISIGISVLGVIVAMLYGFAFGSPTEGFFFSLAFFTVSVIFQISAIIGNLSDLDEEMLTQAERIARNEHTLKLAFSSFMTTFMLLLLCCMPLLINNFDNWGLEVNVWAGIGLVCGFVGLSVGFLIYLLINTSLQKRGIIRTEPGKLTLNRLRIRYLVIAILVLVVIFVGQILALILIDNMDMSRVTFNNWDDFKEYVERPILRSGAEYDANEMQYEHLSLEHIYDESGNVLCSFYHRNFAVFGWEYNQNIDGTWIIEAADLTRIHRGENIMQRIVLPAFLLMYPFAGFGIYISYRKKAKKA